MADVALSPASVAMPPMVADPRHNTKIDTYNVPIVDLPQATPSVTGSAGLQLQYTLAEPQMTNTSLPHAVLPCAAMPIATMQVAMQPPMQAAMQPAGMQFTTMPSVVSPSVMTARPNQLRFISAPLKIQGAQFQGSYA